MGRDFMSWGLPVGRITGIPIKIHWILLFFWLWQLETFLGYAGDYAEFSGGEALLAWVLFVGLCFGCVLLHELGHCYAARRVGGSAHEILLWPLGGLAMVQAPHAWRAQLLTAAGGPAVTLGIVVLSFATFSLLDATWPAGQMGTNYWIIRESLIGFQLYLLVFNLIPLYPLDGGRMFQALAWRHQERKAGYGDVPYLRASMMTVWAGRVTAAVGIAVMLLVFNSLMGVFILVWALFEAENLKRRALAGGGGGSETTFGYDFSQGYRSLERSGPARPRRKARRGWFFRKRAERPDPADIAESPAADERRLDELLEKINREGMDSLSRRERRFLLEMSRRRR
jgi:Zn-dependent protease